MSKPRGLKLVFGVILTLILVVTLTGCPQQQPAATPAATAPAAATAAPATKPAAATPAASTPAAAATKPAAAASGVITALVTQEPDTLMPFVSQMMASTQVQYAIFARCILLDNENEWVASACESMPTLENGGAKFVGEGVDRHLEATFKWKQGLKWHDGTPTTSKDVVFTHKLMLDPDFPATQRDTALRIAEVKAVDNQTFTLVWHSEKTAKEAAANGWAGFDSKDLYVGYDEQVGPVLDPEYFASSDMVDHILPEHILGKVAPADLEKHDFGRNPVGNGAYKLKEWVPAQNVVVEAADNGIWKPRTQTIVFKIVADATAVLNGLAAGEAQVVVNPGLDLDQVPELDKLAADKKIIPYYQPAAAWEHIDFNLTNPLFQDKNLRKAIAHGIDREEIVDKVLYGKSVVMHVWFASAPWALDEQAITKYEYNPTKAKELLAASGWKAGSDGIMEKDGQKLRFKLQTTTAKLRQQVGPIVQANLKEIGIQLEPEYLPGRGLFEDQGPLQQGTFETALYTWISSPDPSPTSLYLGKNCVGETQGINYPCFKNAEFDRLSLQSDSELDRDKRKAMLSQLQKIWTDELPSLPLFQRIQVTASTPKLQNYKPTLSNTPDTWNAYEWILSQ